MTAVHPRLGRPPASCSPPARSTNPAATTEANLTSASILARTSSAAQAARARAPREPLRLSLAGEPAGSVASGRDLVGALSSPAGQQAHRPSGDVDITGLG